jgi:hypothetical protein
MYRTPAGVFMSLVVSVTNSTGGPAKTSPGQAASSMPGPTIIV